MRAQRAAAYAPAGLDPACLVGCYGLAESTLLVSGAWATDPKTRTVEAAAFDQGRAECDCTRHEEITDDAHATPH